MYRTFIKPLGLLTVLALVGFFTACQKEDEAVSVDTFVDESVYEIEERSGTGFNGCYELVFPVTLQFADTTTATVNTYEELRLAIRTWYEANGGHHRPGNRPVIVFPFQVVNDAGEIITIENQEQLQELKALCRPDGGGPGPGGPGGHGGHHGSGPCFTIVFPVTVIFPDNSQVTVNSPQEYRQAIHAWKENNPNTPGRPTYAFPLTVTLRDGTQVTVNSIEELRALKEACRG